MGITQYTKMPSLNKVRVVALTALALFAIFTPDLDSYGDFVGRSLAAVENRELQDKPAQCGDYVRLDYSEKDIQIIDDRRIIKKEISPGVSVTIEAFAKTDNVKFSDSRLNVYDTTGASPGNCDKDLENLKWEENSVQPFPAVEINKVLVIQETSGTCGHTEPTYGEPNDDGGGGIIRFTFSKAITMRAKVFVADQDDNVRATELFINGISEGFVGGASDSEVSSYCRNLSQE